MNQEPSILDYIKARIHYGLLKIFHPSAVLDKSEHPEIWPELEKEGISTPSIAEGGQQDLPPGGLRDFWRTLLTFVKGLLSHWRTLLAFGLGLLAQYSLEPHAGADRTWVGGIILYVLAGLALVWANLKHEWSLQMWNVNAEDVSEDKQFLHSSAAFIASLVFSLIAFGTFKSGLFTWYNLIIWLLALLTMVLAFWQPGANIKNWFRRLRDIISHPNWNIKIDRWALLVLAAFGLILFFRTYRLAEVPSQMISDHAEKLLDIGDVLNGKTSVFFPRNGGREFFQFYLSAAIILLFKTGLTFMSLKIGSTLAGLATLYYIYLLGKEIGNSRVGLLVMVFTGIAYWPNVISRFGLRLPMYPLFYAPALYYLIRGLRMRNRNNFALSGLFLGLGLNGYTAYRVVPFVILIAIGLYILHKQSKGYRRQTFWGLFALVTISFIVFIPLLRFMIENPTGVIYRSMSRLGTWERPLPGPAWQIFLQNLRNSLTMFGWDNGEVWAISVPNIPALDMISAALFHLGVVLLTIRYIRQKNWTDIFTLISIPVLMMPSILSLAFPGENPSMSRSAGVIIPVFLIVGLALDGLLKLIESMSATSWNKHFAWLVGFVLLAGASVQNYDLVFNQYRKQYDLSSWNTSEIGQVVHDFTDMVGTSQTQWLVGYPYWVDSRLVMFNAGFPMQDDAIFPENFQNTLSDTRAKLFLVNIQDTTSLETLQSLYPTGWVTEYKSTIPDKDFLIFLVPPQSP